MRQRRETVEHPFGTIKARMGATHFLMKTLPRVASEMALHVLAYNLTRVMNIMGIQPLMGSDQGIVRPEKVQGPQSRRPPKMYIPPARRAFLHGQDPYRTPLLGRAACREFLPTILRRCRRPSRPRPEQAVADRAQKAASTINRGHDPRRVECAVAIGG
jgi:Transposase DDE domain